MSKFSSFIKWLTPLGWSSQVLSWIFGRDSYLSQVLGNVGDPISNLVKGTTGSGLTTAQIEQNAWNSEEAQKQRDWTAQMDNTKYQRQTADMMAAGLNPAMMYGGSVSASAPSGAAASGSSVANPSAGLLDSLLNVIFAKQRLENLRKEGHAIEAGAEKDEAEAGLARSNIGLTDAKTQYQKMVNSYYPNLTTATIDRIWSESEYFKSSSSEKLSEIDVNQSKVALNDAETAIKGLEKEWLPKIREAQTKEATANAVKAFADAAWQSYATQYAKDHAGVTPGRDAWTGFAATLAECISHAVSDVGDFVDDLVPKWLRRNK